jgi:hypothetical protein
MCILTIPDRENVVRWTEKYMICILQARNDYGIGCKTRQTVRLAGAAEGVANARVHST